VYGRVTRIVYVHYHRQDLPLGPSDMLFRDGILSNTYHLDEEAGLY
jgi:hypothetical protein